MEKGPGQEREGKGSAGRGEGARPRRRGGTLVRGNHPRSAHLLRHAWAVARPGRLPASRFSAASPPPPGPPLPPSLPAFFTFSLSLFLSFRVTYALVLGLLLLLLPPLAAFPSCLRASLASLRPLAGEAFPLPPRPCLTLPL